MPATVEEFRRADAETRHAAKRSLAIALQLAGCASMCYSAYLAWGRVGGAAVGGVILWIIGANLLHRREPAPGSPASTSSADRAARAHLN